MHIDELDTPALLIDLGIMERNLALVAAYAKTHGLRLRPHTKTHKIPALAAMQLAMGAAGLTVAKPGEAEVMLASGTPDMLIAFPVIGAGKLRRLMEVARRTRVTVSLDSLFAAGELSAAAASAGLEVGVRVEMDAGLRRVGVVPGPDVVALARQIDRLPGLRFEGIAFYPGHIRGEDQQALGELSQVLDGVIGMLRDSRLAPKIVSGGSTPTLYHSHLITGMNEIRPGTYIFNDLNTVLSGACKLDDCAASILATVISTAVAGQAVIDGGSKTFSSDRPVAGELRFGHVAEAPDAVFTKMNEEHGYVNTQACATPPRIGDRVRVIPNHVCVAMNLHETVYGIRGERVEQMWRVEGRGKLQ